MYTEDSEERNSDCAKSMVKEYVSRNTRIYLSEVAYARGKERAKSRMGKSAQKVQKQG